MQDPYAEWLAQQQAAQQQAAQSPAEQPEPELDAAPTPPEDKPAPQVPAVGDRVGFTWVNPLAGAGGEEQTRYGIVLEVVDAHPDGSERLDAGGQAAPAAVVGWFTEVSDPVPVSDLDW